MTPVLCFIHIKIGINANSASIPCKFFEKYFWFPAVLTFPHQASAAKGATKATVTSSQ